MSRGRARQPAVPKAYSCVPIKASGYSGGSDGTWAGLRPQAREFPSPLVTVERPCVRVTPTSSSACDAEARSAEIFCAGMRSK